MKHGTDVHASLGISSDSKSNHTSVEGKECCNQLDFSVHKTIIGVSFAAPWLQIFGDDETVDSSNVESFWGLKPPPGLVLYGASHHPC
uniref:hypothetical protein n=1 Tax=Synechococcus sp. UW106 TaxID=368495 RepID=UPI0014829783|nr:hypothetical protein [Synechococcus sp. UW106]